MKFAVVSDVHAEQHPDWSRLVFERMAARTDLDFVAFLGDVCTSPGDDWERWFRPLYSLLTCPVYGTRGNHDDVGRWDQWFGAPEDFVKTFPDCRCVFFDSNDWTHNGTKSEWLLHSARGPEKYRFLFTHLTPRIGHWCYGMGSNRTGVYLDVCRQAGVTASFTGHMHGFDVQREGGTLFFLCGGGGGNRHDDHPVLHRSNYYLLVDTEPDFHVTLCQQHRDREQERPMGEWLPLIGKADAF